MTYRHSLLGHGTFSFSDILIRIKYMRVFTPDSTLKLARRRTPTLMDPDPTFPKTDARIGISKKIPSCRYKN